MVNVILSGGKAAAKDLTSSSTGNAVERDYRCEVNHRMFLSIAYQALKTQTDQPTTDD
jgi:hypothetical protein